MAAPVAATRVSVCVCPGVPKTSRPRATLATHSVKTTDRAFAALSEAITFLRQTALFWNGELFTKVAVSREVKEALGGTVAPVSEKPMIVFAGPAVTSTPLLRED
eukprot:scaffold665_cov341-Prasinococcus_capsulatus_cf.AAC.12